MAKLSVLEEPRTFPPKKFLLIIWGTTLVISLAGIISSSGVEIVLYIWLVIAGVAFWQIWTLRWVQVDNEGIRMRNVFHRGRELQWEEVKEFHEEEVRLSGRSFYVVHLSNKQSEADKRITKIQLTSDLIGFETLRTIIREAVPKID